MRNPIKFRNQSSQRARSTDEELTRGFDIKPAATIFSSRSIRAKEHDEKQPFSQETTMGHTITMPSKDSVAERLEAQMVDVFFSYGKPTKDNYALKGVNMNVMKGEIYALLGPSGCGKTTVLNCFTQLIKPSAGEVWNYQTGTEDIVSYGAGIGFMPQDLSLFPELTIEETLVLFSKIYSVTSKELQQRIEQFSKLVQLPPRTRQIGQLSGGQQRRVSFVCALLRDAPLLILDEPTVGLDPILRQTIWNYLMELTSKMNKTVLLTTHYIDEAKDATMIGLMRDGQVLKETSPCDLMRQFGESSLEQCFYRICVSSDTSVPEDNADCLENENLLIACSRGRETRLLRQDPPAKRRLSRMKKLRVKSSRVASNVGCLTVKNMKNLKRSLIMMFMQFVIPSLVVAVFRIAVGENLTDLKVAIVNEEDPIYLSEQFLEELDTFLVIRKNYQTLQDGIKSVENGENLVAVHFQPDFSYCLLLNTQLGVFSNNATADCATVKLYMDSTNQILSLTLQRYMLDSFDKVKLTVLEKLDSNPALVNLPIQFVEPIYGNLDNKFIEFVTPAVLLFVVYTLQAALTAIALIMERESGVFQRLQVSGVSKAEIFAAQIINNCFVVVVQITMMLIVQFWVFTAETKGNMACGIFLIFLQGIAGTLFGFFISSLTKDVNTGLIIGMGCIYPNFILCGFVWPMEGMPRGIKSIAYFAPLSMSIEALRSIFHRGWGFFHWVVWLGIISAIGWSIVFLVVGMLIYKLKK